MAKKQTAIRNAELDADEVPTFTLRADKRGHIRALMAALQELPGEAVEGLSILRQFDLYEEEHR